MRAADLLRTPALDRTRWSIAVRELGGASLLELGSRRRLSTASVAKIFLLLEVAARIESGELDPLERVSADAVEPVADSGVWHHLAQRELPIADAATLVGAVSDNLATNVLLHRVGLDAVQARARTLASHGSMLHDIVRDVRTLRDPPALSTGTAADWASIVSQLERGEPVGRRVAGWLERSADHSMVLSPLGLDPLCGTGAAFNKTGSDDGVRADVGVVRGPARSIAYAAICNWDAGAGPDPLPHVLQAMRDLGSAIAERSRERD